MDSQTGPNFICDLQQQIKSPQTEKTPCVWDTVCARCVTQTSKANPLQLLHSCCAASQSQMKVFFQQEVSYSPILEQEGSSIILGARGAHSGPPMRVSVLRARFPAIAFPQTVKALPSSYPRAHVQRWQVALFVQPHTLGPILGLWWVVPPLYVRSGDTQGDWWTEKLKVQIYVKSLKEQIFALMACKTRGSWNKRKKGYLQS